VKPTWALLLISCSALVACQTGPSTRQPLGDDALCSLRAITVSDAVRAHLRAQLHSDAMPDGYEQFLRDIAAHNAKIRVHCDGG
jgi:hypothetical protein